ncbi:MAG TPA: AAA family ATPase [Steroidobacter sp.]|nr:AAA family ATPase [Steroidobacter sp.]
MLPVRRAYELDDRPEEQRWLIDELWADPAVGIVGGEPKCCKSFLALDVAVSVASGTPCLRRFAVSRRGPVLLYAAEDALDVVRRRLAGIAEAAGTSFRSLDVHVITAPSVRLDARTDRDRLRETVAAVMPRLLILDPFVRLHRIDENAAAEVAPLLAYLRELQREHQVAVMLVHHARKGAGRIRAGQALRGTSELHAWGDSNLYLRRCRDELALSIEHRAAPSPGDLRLALRGDRDAVALEVVERDHLADEVDAAAEASLGERILDLLAEAEHPMSSRALRRACGVRTATLGEALRQLERDQVITRSSAGFELGSRPRVSASRAPLHNTGNGNRKHPDHDEKPGETKAGSAEVQPAEG